MIRIETEAKNIYHFARKCRERLRRAAMIEIALFGSTFFVNANRPNLNLVLQYARRILEPHGDRSSGSTFNFPPKVVFG